MDRELIPAASERRATAHRARLVVLTSVVALSVGLSDPAGAQGRRGSVDVDWSVLDDLSRGQGATRPRTVRPQAVRRAPARPAAMRSATTQQALDRLAEVLAAQTAELQRIRESVATSQAAELETLRDQVRRQGEEIERLRVSGRVRDDRPTATGEATPPEPRPARPRVPRSQDYAMAPPVGRAGGAPYATSLSPFAPLAGRFGNSQHATSGPVDISQLPGLSTDGCAPPTDYDVPSMAPPYAPPGQSMVAPQYPPGVAPPPPMTGASPYAPPGPSMAAAPPSAARGAGTVAGRFGDSRFATSGPVDPALLPGGSGYGPDGQPVAGTAAVTPRYPQGVAPPPPFTSTGPRGSAGAGGSSGRAPVPSIIAGQDYDTPELQTPEPPGARGRGAPGPSMAAAPAIASRGASPLAGRFGNSQQATSGPVDPALLSGDPNAIPPPPQLSQTAPFPLPPVGASVAPPASARTEIPPPPMLMPDQRPSAAGSRTPLMAPPSMSPGAPLPAPTSSRPDIPPPPDVTGGRVSQQVAALPQSRSASADIPPAPVFSPGPGVSDVRPVTQRPTRPARGTAQAAPLPRTAAAAPPPPARDPIPPAPSIGAAPPPPTALAPPPPAPAAVQLPAPAAAPPPPVPLASAPPPTPAAPPPSPPNAAAPLVTPAARPSTAAPLPTRNGVPTPPPPAPMAPPSAAAPLVSPASPAPVAAPPPTRSVVPTPPPPAPAVPPSAAAPLVTPASPVPAAPPPIRSVMPAPPPPAPAAPPSQPAAGPPPQQVAAAPVATAAGNAIARVDFAGGATELSDAGQRGLDRAVAELQRDQNARLQLVAYATGGSGDDGGSVARRLSLSRALAVRSYLIEQGIRATRMDVRALGSRSADGSAASDRVDVLLVRR